MIFPNSVGFSDKECDRGEIIAVTASVVCVLGILFLCFLHLFGGFTVSPIFFLLLFALAAFSFYRFYYWEDQGYQNSLNASAFSAMADRDR